MKKFTLILTACALMGFVAANTARADHRHSRPGPSHHHHGQIHRGYSHHHHHHHHNLRGGFGGYIGPHNVYRYSSPFGVYNVNPYGYGCNPYGSGFGITRGNFGVYFRF